MKKIKKENAFYWKEETLSKLNTEQVKELINALPFPL